MTRWHSKSLRGPGSTVTWGPPFPSPPLSPPSPSPPSFPHLPQPNPSPCREAASKSSKGVWGSDVSSARSGAELQPKSNLVHFSLKIRHLVATVLMIVLRVLPKIHYSGAPGARGPRFIELPEVLNPRFLRH